MLTETVNAFVLRVCEYQTWKKMGILQQTPSKELSIKIQGICHALLEVGVSLVADTYSNVSVLISLKDCASRLIDCKEQ